MVDNTDRLAPIFLLNDHVSGERNMFRIVGEDINRVLPLSFDLLQLFRLYSLPTFLVR